MKQKKIENLLQDTLHCNCLSFIHGNHHQGDYILLKDKIMNDEHWWKNKTKKLVVYYNEHDDDDRLFQNGHHSFIKKTISLSNSKSRTEHPNKDTYINSIFFLVYINIVDLTLFNSPVFVYCRTIWRTTSCFFFTWITEMNGEEKKEKLEFSALTFILSKFNWPNIHGGSVYFFLCVC